MARRNGSTSPSSPRRRGYGGAGEAQRRTDQARSVSMLAAAIVQLASHRRGVLLEPCCGGAWIPSKHSQQLVRRKGATLTQPLKLPQAGAAPGTGVRLSDARELLLPNDSVGASSSQLPAGAQRPAAEGWSRSGPAPMLSGLSQLPGPRSGSFSCSAPEFARSAAPFALRLRRQCRFRFAGAASRSGWSRGAGRLAALPAKDESRQRAEQVQQACRAPSASDRGSARARRRFIDDAAIFIDGQDRHSSNNQDPLPVTEITPIWSRPSQHPSIHSTASLVLPHRPRGQRIVARREQLCRICPDGTLESNEVAIGPMAVARVVP